MASFYREQEGRLISAASLWEALALEDVPHSVISLVGAGGKTTTMYQLAEELKKRGKRVIVTTSTHIMCPTEYPVLLLSRAEELQKYEEVLTSGIVVAVGKRLEETNKLVGMQLTELQKLTEYCDVLLIEADGSKRLPLKRCAEHEPVICDGTQVVIGCVGMSAVGQCWQNVCFRWERDSRYEGTEIIQPGHVAEILADRENGTRKHAGDRMYRVLLNQVDNEKQKQLAEEIVSCLHQDETEKIWVAASAYQSEE